MTIGNLARAAGVGVETIRYYARLGLIEQPRAASGYRASHLARLRYIRNAKALRLSLKDIAALQRQLNGGPQFCAAVRAAVTAKREGVERQLAELAVLRDDLDAFLQRCASRPPGELCPIAADLTA